jgi:hypothetical protein
MIKYFSKRDIMELLCVTAAQFEYGISKIGITPQLDSERIYSYTISDMIDIYNFVYNRKRVITIESKINYKEIRL